jgi:hypothetical protein
VQLRTCLAVAGFAALVVTARSAGAYPQFQFSKDANRCSMCHFSPTGGGLLNDYGRQASATQISQTEGNPYLLHGLYKEHDYYHWGADLRFASLYRDQGEDPDEPHLFWFPMQGDFYSYAKFGDWVSMYAAIGPRAAAREPKQSFAERLTARELYFTIRRRNRGYYGRVGRFYAPFGLRSQNHTDFVRRYLGFHSYEETLNVSGGRVENAYEWHAAAFAAIPYDLLGNGPRGGGATFYYEQRPGKADRLAVAGQAKLRLSGEDQHYIVGGVGKYWLESAKVLLMGELDLALQGFDDGPSRAQFVGYAGATYFPLQGLMVSAVLENYVSDLSVERTDRSAASLVLQYFPRSHHELMLIGKAEAVSGLSDPGGYVMLQYHYWL